MKPNQYLKEKQIQWALNQELELRGSDGDRGVRAYTSTVDENLFEPLSDEAREQISSGDGGELEAKGEQRSRMQAVHSSSALPVNIFQYWQRNGDLDAITSACGFCRLGSSPSAELKFEKKFPIFENARKHPNLDVAFVNKPGSRYRFFAVESKFTETYGGRSHGGLKPIYLRDHSIWRGLPNLRKLASVISPADDQFDHLHAAQLIKHILGLSRVSGGKDRFRLLYLWNDVFGGEGIQHRKEIDRFMEIAKQDGVRFQALTCQDLILRLADKQREDHPEYIRYLVDRYL
ncbi:MAG: hypothetical protein P1U58_14175 [Verrucomicrobiales bacterium]|nr:hypothetical protein [Verrucomicrobiales bacterium]